MPFQLTIAEGKEAGREFVFEQPQVVIGRTAECDVVLYDPGVSRKHARIFNEGNGYFVEDMGSSNGTKVNGSVVKKQKLANGDSVSLGPVVFSFNLEAKAAANPAGGAEAIAHQGTHVFTMAEAQARRQVGKGSALAPTGANSEELRAIQRTDTRSVAALKPKMSSPQIQRLPSASNPGLAAPRSNSSPPVRSAPGIRGSKQAGLSAADRARIRRDNPGMLGAIKLFWAEANGAQRGVVVSVLVLIGLGLIGGAFYYVALDNGNTKPKGPEPVLLTKRPISDSFGLGEGVMWERADQKVFDFEFVSATKAVVMLHFQSSDISEGEVVMTVNGVDIGKLPADTLNSFEVSHDQLVPPEILKKGQKNQVIFDNMKNPPGSETWRIWNVWVEVIPLPEESTDDLVRDANDAYRQGQLMMERRDVGAGNRYEAWKSYRRSWLLLEAHPNPKPELYGIARAKVREAQVELDRQCAKLMLEGLTAYEHKDWNGARAVFDHVKDYFPSTDQPCSFRAEQKRNELNL